MGIGKLVLYSNSAESPLTEIGTIINSLQEMGLLGQPIYPGKDRFLTGERFLQLISFVGCSTNVCLAPKTDQDTGYCHLIIKGPFSQPRLFWGKNKRPPRCPACKETISDREDNIDNWTIRCSKCGNTTKLEDINWGRQAGYGHIFIEISNVFSGEARPVHDLLVNLGQLTDSKWDYFFAE